MSAAQVEGLFGALGGSCENDRGVVGKVAGTVLGLAVLGGSLSPASPAEAAGDVRSDVVLCKPTAFIAMLAPAGSSVAVSGQSLSKKGVRRSGGQIRATMSATGTVTTTATYEAEGEVTRCDGSGPAKETLTVKVTANASSAVAAKASVKGRSKKAAYRAAKKAVRAKLRDKGVDANAPVIKRMPVLTQRSCCWPSWRPDGGTVPSVGRGAEVPRGPHV